MKRSNMYTNGSRIEIRRMEDKTLKVCVFLYAVTVNLLSCRADPR